MTDAERDGYVNVFAGWSREGNFNELRTQDGAD